MYNCTMYAYMAVDLQYQKEKKREKKVTVEHECFIINSQLSSTAIRPYALLIHCNLYEKKLILSKNGDDISLSPIGPHVAMQ